jgi:hypothetical protein
MVQLETAATRQRSDALVTIALVITTGITLAEITVLAWLAVAP